MTPNTDAAAGTAWDSPANYPFMVRYYDAKASKRGKGVQARLFKTREAAEAFAVGRQLYCRPAQVEARS